MDKQPVAAQSANTQTTQRILLTQAESGLVLAEPVVSIKKAVLCGAGTALSDELIHRLMLLGIKRVVVFGQQAPMRDAPSVDDREVMLDQRFSRCGNQALMNNLREAIRRRIRETPA